MKTKDLPENKSLDGIKFIYPADRQQYYLTGMWNKGAWAKKDLKSNQIFPLCFETMSDFFEWEVVD